MRSVVDGIRLVRGDMVAATMPAGPGLVALLDACWEAGAALLPLDPRLPETAHHDLVERAAPTVTIEGDVARRVEGEPAEEGAGVVVGTSGTTGAPRLVVLSRSAVEAAVRGSAARLGLDGSEPWLLCVPPAHIGGLLVLLRGLLLGSPVVVHEEFDAADAAAAPDVRCVSLVPTMVRRLVSAGVDVAHWRTVLVGGDAVAPGLRAAFPVPLVHTYGQSQSCGGVVYDGVPLPGVTVAVDAGGEVLLGGPTLMSGYRRDPAASAAAWTADGLLRTGDAGEIDNAGLLQVHGRLDDVIITGGEKVSPAVVEGALRSHPAIADAAVVGESDAEWGNRVVAAVVPVDPERPPTLAEVREWVGQHLPSYAAPKDVVLVRALPMTTVGKLRRESVRKLVAAHRSTQGPPPAAAARSPVRRP